MTKTQLELKGFNNESINAIEFSNRWRMNPQWFDDCLVRIPVYLTLGIFDVCGLIDKAIPIGNHNEKNEAIATLTITFKQGALLIDHNNCLHSTFDKDNSFIMTESTIIKIMPIKPTTIN